MTDNFLKFVRNWNLLYGSDLGLVDETVVELLQEPTCNNIILENDAWVDYLLSSPGAGGVNNTKNPGGNRSVVGEGLLPGEGDRPDFPVWGLGLQAFVIFPRQYLVDNIESLLQRGFYPAYLPFSEEHAKVDDGMNSVPRSYREAGTMISLNFGEQYNDAFFVRLVSLPVIDHAVIDVVPPFLLCRDSLTPRSSCLAGEPLPRNVSLRRRRNRFPRVPWAEPCPPAVHWTVEERLDQGLSHRIHQAGAGRKL